MTTEIGSPSRVEIRRAHVLEAARGLFIEQGFHQTGVAQIAAVSGIKVAQIYRDFSGKEDIIAAICERDVLGWLDEQRLAVAVNAGDLPAVRDWMSRFLRRDERVEDCRLMSEIFAEAGRDARVASMNRAIDIRLRQSLAAALMAITGRSDRPPEAKALIDFIMALGVGTTMRRALDPDLDVEALFGLVTDIVEQRIVALSA